MNITLHPDRALAKPTKLQLEENRSTSSKTQDLEKELKEKNLLIGKLRHEGRVIPLKIYPQYL